jgi:hypothetical protein
LFVGDGVTAGGNNIGKALAGTGLVFDTITQTLQATATGSGGIASVSADLSPQLGGNLNLGSHNIVGTGNIATTGTFYASSGLGGNLVLNGNNITGTGNISTTGTLSVTGLGADLALSGHNITGVGSINITGSIVASSSITAGTLSVTGLGADLVLNNHNITGSGNISTTGTLSVTGLGSDLSLNNHNITGTGNISTTGTLSVTGLGADLVLNNHNITGSGNISTTGTLSVTGLGADLVLNNHNITGSGNITVSGTISASSTISAPLYQSVDSGSEIVFSTSNTNALSVITTTDGVSSTPSISLKASRGTLLNPTNNSAGDIIGGYTIKGYGNNVFKLAGSMTVQWAATADLTQSLPGANLLLIAGNNSNNFTIATFYGITGVFNAPLLATTIYSATGTTIPSAATVGVGARAFVSDATVATFGTAYTGGGSNKVPVWSNGTSWYIG